MLANCGASGCALKSLYASLANDLDLNLSMRVSVPTLRRPVLLGWMLYFLRREDTAVRVME